MASGALSVLMMALFDMISVLTIERIQHNLAHSRSHVHLWLGILLIRLYSDSVIQQLDSSVRQYVASIAVSGLGPFA
ncbi:hypothetical protein GCM10007876_34890 [Litoribrevibacter albus]|uniref:Uncharacterized protein n=1 Tax=Litoribrevibacter albus TaxID=1473156 RepID=A0AA37W7R2_9GAMM|nr:hypothetical protein GCM10007876_34890 [Litoribrevibacter albus]